MNTFHNVCDQQLHPAKPSVGDLMKAALVGKQKQISFAKITDTDEDTGDMKLHYLKLKPGSSSVHIWADKAWVPADQELSPVPQPSLAQTWGIDFLFNVQ